MARQRTYLVKEVAEMAGVSVRTLHHYDELRLLSPGARTDAGYRLYAEPDLLRLQQILLGREQGLSLEEIRRALDDPEFDRKAALLRQRAELEKRAGQTAAMLRAVERALLQLEGEDMDPREIFEGFEPARYETETEERWGTSDAFAESKRRTARYTREDWEQLKAEQAAIYEDLARLMLAGAAVAAPEALAVVERHRQSIERWFYPCSLEMHRRLAALYEQDPRFAANIDKYGAALTPFLVAAIRENAKTRDE
jgi:MerR family transcriptional regulator, thiopeptide resistance regulator